MPEYAWMIPGYVWLCLNVPKFVWMAFDWHSPFVIPYLKESQTVFSENKNLLFSIVAGSIWFCFLFLDGIFLQLRFQICYYLWGPKGPEALNLTQSLRCPINISMVLFLWFIYLFRCCFFFTFWHFKRVSWRFTKAVSL